MPRPNLNTPLAKKHHTAVIDNGDRGACTLHTTRIVEFDPDWLIIDCGGFNTPTTRRRIDECSMHWNLGIQAYSKGGTLRICNRAAGWDVPIVGRTRINRHTGERSRSNCFDHVCLEERGLLDD